MEGGKLMASIFEKWGVAVATPSPPPPLATLAKIAGDGREIQRPEPKPSLAKIATLAGGHGESEKPIPHYDVDERAAIMAVGGMPQDWAKGFASLNPDRPPQGLSKREWVTRLDSALSFTDVHRQALHGLGWTFEALFSVGEHWVRLDQRAHGWFIAEALSGGGRILEADASKIVFSKANGARFTVWRSHERQG
jgi:hypothetical protein